MSDGDKNPSVHGEKRASSARIWITAAILGGFFGASMWWAFGAWESVPDRMTTNGFVAMVLGVIFTIALGAGLMALVFWSHRKGYDR
jgi:hypothetical protein